MGGAPKSDSEPAKGSIVNEFPLLLGGFLSFSGGGGGGSFGFIFTFYFYFYDVFHPITVIERDYDAC